MNIDDVSIASIEIPNEPIGAMYDRQLALAIKYAPLERRNGYYFPDPMNLPPIDDGQLQQWIKSMAWRVTEEIAEGWETWTYEIGVGTEWKKHWHKVEVRHFFEELSDMTAFMVELMAVLEVPKSNLTEIVNSVYNGPGPFETGASPLSWLSHARDFIFRLGLAANALKNKPWKSTQMQTDERVFHERLLIAWEVMWRLWRCFTDTAADAYQIWALKYVVNEFRQRTNY